MKKSILKLTSLLFAFTLLVSLVACGGSSDAPASSAAPAPESEGSSSADSSVPEESTAAPAATGEEVDSLSAFLSDEQVALYNGAHETYLEVMGFAAPGSELFYVWEDGVMDANNLETAEYNGTVYYKANGEIQTWDEFYALMTSYFTPEFVEEMIGTNTEYPLFVDIDGGLYSGLGGRGNHIDYVGPDLYMLEDAGEESITFQVIGQYVNQSTEEAYKESFPIVMANTEDGWRFEVFNITF